MNCHPERSRGICGAPLGLPESSLLASVKVSFRSVDTASSQPGDLILPRTPAEPSTAIPSPSGLQLNLLQDLWLAANGESCGITCDEFSKVLTSVGEKHNYGQAAGVQADAAQRVTFLRSLHLPELALAHSCALGREAGWQRFLSIYRDSLTQAAIAIAGSATLGHELADSLYAELYGLRELDGQRRSPLASYSGRGSLLGWLRTTLAQRHIDHHRRTRREEPLDDVEPSAPGLSSSPEPAELARLTDAVSLSLQALAPEDRYMLSAYFLDRQSLLEISRVLHIHEATVSRRLKRLVADLRERLIQNLQTGGLSKRAAQEALGTDPRDIELNLRAVLQTSQTPTFSGMAASATGTASDKI
jgi:RNA polymerase sigma-70 factor, ECF subfamily